MSVVAHQDDDLLFQSPRLFSAIRGGMCVRTVYVTAGDANDTPEYWASRENGVKAAYAAMAGVSNSWTTSDAGVPGHPIPVAKLNGTAGTISLAFMRLPDGFRDGRGGSNNGFQSLQKLYSGIIDSITAVDNSSSYTISTLQATLLGLMNNYSPNQILTLDYGGTYGDGDHSDHHTVAYLTMAAHQQYAIPHTFTGYLGYGIAELPSNVVDPDLSAKTNAFLTYAEHDSKTCNTAELCASRSEGAWLSRSYVVTKPALSEGSGTSENSGGTNVAASATVSASSQNTTSGQTAAKAVDGVIAGYPGDSTREWATIGGKAGSYIHLAFPSPVTLNKLVLHDRPNTNDQITGGTLTFSDGSTVAVPSLDNSGAATTVSFTSRTTTSVKLTITSVSGTTRNIGLSELQAYTAPAVAPGTNVAASATVSASSQNTTSGQTAAKAVDGVIAGYPGDSTREWATIGGKAGSYIHLAFPSPVTLNKLVLHDRPNTNDQITGGTLTFSDGSTVAVPSLDNSGAATTVSFTSRTTTSVKLTITSVSGTTRNIGLSELQAYTN